MQRRNRRAELYGLVPADAGSVTWTPDRTAAATAADLVPPAKLWLDGVPAAVLDSAVRQGVLVGRLGLTDARGTPLGAAVRPPLIEWSAAAS